MWLGNPERKDRTFNEILILFGIKGGESEINYFVTQFVWGNRETWDVIGYSFGFQPKFIKLFNLVYILPCIKYDIHSEHSCRVISKTPGLTLPVY